MLLCEPSETYDIAHEASVRIETSVSFNKASLMDSTTLDRCVRSLIPGLPRTKLLIAHTALRFRIKFAALARG